MTSTDKPSAPEEPAWKTCEFCSNAASLRGLPLGDDLSHLEELSLTKLREKDMIGLGRCPHCHTIYLKEGDHSPDHWYSFEIYISPLSNDEALQWLTRLNTDEARQWLDDLDI